MKMYVPFCYEKMGRIEVEANSVREAQGKAQDILDEMSWKDCGRLAECVDDSAQIDYDGIILDENQNIVEVKHTNNGNHIHNHLLNWIMR